MFDMFAGMAKMVSIYADEMASKDNDDEMLEDDDREDDDREDDEDEYFD